MEKSNTCSLSNTLAFSSIFLSIVICFVALIHVEVELHTHRELLQALSERRVDNVESCKESIASSLHSDSGEGKLGDQQRLPNQWRRWVTQFFRSCFYKCAKTPNTCTVEPLSSG